MLVVVVMGSSYSEAHIYTSHIYFTYILDIHTSHQTQTKLTLNDQDAAADADADAD